MDNLDRCFQKGLLVKLVVEPELAQKSLKRAKNVLKEIPKVLSLNLLEMAEQRLYQAVFHGVKALLYQDGVREKSHICVSLYFKAQYINQVPSAQLDLLDRLRDVRHESQYGLEEVMLDQDQIKDWLQEAKDLLRAIEKILK